VSEKHDRQFTGWWIPRKIVDLYKEKQLSAKEMILLVIVDGLSKSNEGCFASNEYLADETQLTVTNTSKAISKLKDMGLLVQTGFDGRKRFLKTSWSEHLEKTSQTCHRRQGRLVMGDKHIVKTIAHSEVNFRKSRDRRAVANRENNSLHSSPFDLKAAGRLREVLVLNGSDLVSPPRAARISTFAKHIRRLRIDRNVEEKDIRRVIVFLKHCYRDQYTPKIRKADDLFVHWEKFRDAADRYENNGVEKGEVSDAVKQTAEWKRKKTLIPKIREKAAEMGCIDLSGKYSSFLEKPAFPFVLKELGLSKDSISWEFYISDGREDDR